MIINQTELIEPIYLIVDIIIALYKVNLQYLTIYILLSPLLSSDDHKVNYHDCFKGLN